MSLIRTTYVRDFDYEPVAPFVVQEVSINLYGMTEFDVPTLEAAVRMFADEMIPVRWGRMCSVIDGSHRIVLQYYAEHQSVDPQWWGVRSCFEELDRINAGHPVDRAIWETLAKEAAR